MKINISIIGSTGSIGLSVLKIIDKRNKNFQVNVLTANKNYKLIKKKIKKYKPKIFIISDLNTFKKIKRVSCKTKILNILMPLDWKKERITVSAIPGIIGLHPTLTMIKFSKLLIVIRVYNLWMEYNKKRMK